jgi:hypothetical protein
MGGLMADEAKRIITALAERDGPDAAEQFHRRLQSLGESRP